MTLKELLFELFAKHGHFYTDAICSGDGFDSGDLERLRIAYLIENPDVAHDVIAKISEFQLSNHIVSILKGHDSAPLFIAEDIKMVTGSAIDGLIDGEIDHEWRAYSRGNMNVVSIEDDRSVER